MTADSVTFVPHASQFNLCRTAGFVLDLFLDTVDGGDTLLRNVRFYQSIVRLCISEYETAPRGFIHSQTVAA
jgi:hypothetical protein